MSALTKDDIKKAVISLREHQVNPLYFILVETKEFEKNLEHYMSLGLEVSFDENGYMKFKINGEEV